MWVGSQINIGVTVLGVAYLVYFWVNFISNSLESFWGLKVATDKAEDLKKALLNSGYSIDAAKKIVAHYTKEAESS